MFRVERKFKSYENRRLVIYDGNKLIDKIRPWYGWFGHEFPLSEIEDYYNEIHSLIIENLYWLLGKDCDEGEWKELIEYWDKGKHVFGVSIDKLPESMFKTQKEKQIALKSFNK